jgi:hypothetical protein
MRTVTSPAFENLLSQAQSRLRELTLAQEERQREERAQNLERFTSSFPLTADEQKALSISFHNYGNTTNAYAAIHGVWGDQYVIVTADGSRWQAEVYRKGVTSVRLFARVEAANLRDQLVLGIANYRAKCEEELAEQFRREQEQAARAADVAKREAEAKVVYERRQAAIEAKRAEVLATHAELVAEVERQKTAALAALWQWPAGVTLTLYRWRWNIAAAVGENNELVVDYDDGWSLQAEPNYDGFVFFQPAIGRPRGLAIKPANVAFIERHTFARVADLHDDLVLAENLPILGIGYQRYHEVIATADGDRVQVSTEDGGPVLLRGEDRELRIELGNIPKRWVRELLDQTVGAS